MKKRTMILSTVISACLLAAAVTSAVVFLNSGTPGMNERAATTSDRAYSKAHTVYSGSFKSELTKDELVFYNAYEQHFLAENSLDPFEIDVSGMKFLATEQSKIWAGAEMGAYAFYNDHPEAYWVDSTDIGFDCDDDGQYIVKAVVTPHERYNGAYNERDTVQNGVESAVNEIRASRKSESRYDTVKAIHDYICDNLSFYPGYQEQYASEQQCAAPLFGGGSIGKNAVCEGYSMAFKLLCDRFDVPAAVIGSRSHAFNYVQMDDGCYYAVDCLWDDENPTRYDYFLVGCKTALFDTFDDSHHSTVWRFNDDYDHVEYWYYGANGVDEVPFVYPKVSEQAYSCIELLEDSADSDGKLSGTASFRFRYKGSDFAGKKADVYFGDKLIGTPELDENGIFEATCDTSQLYNGYKCLKAVVGDMSLKQYIEVRNPQFEILNWNDEVLTIYEPYEVHVKEYSTDEIKDCKIEVWLDHTDPYEESPFAVSGFNSDGETSFVIDPQKCGDGLHQIRVVFHKPGGNSFDDYLNQYILRSFRVSNSAPDSGGFRFWGQSAKSDRYVGEWADFTLKYDGTVTKQCQFSVTIDDAPVTPLRQGDDTITDFFDEDGFCRFYLDVTGLNNGTHTVQATLTKEDGSTVTTANTVNVTDGYCKFELWQRNNSGDYVPYSDRNTVINNSIKMQVQNISGAPSNNCRVRIYEDDMLKYDYDITKDIYDIPGDDNFFTLVISSPDVKFGKHVLKAVFMTPDGMIVEKSLPFHLNPAPKSYDNLSFSVNGLRNVGNTVDFTLNYDTPFPACKNLSITLDGKPADIQIPDDPASAFDYFGRFFFTLDFTNAQHGKHTVQAKLTKEDGAVMTARQMVFVTDDYFKITNWPKTEPTLHGVAEVKVKNLSENLTVPSTVRQYIDGEDMGVVSFDEKGMATLNLNTAGLEKGEHWYKVVFTGNDGVTAERLMRFRVE